MRSEAFRILTRWANAPVLRVTDSGLGIPADELPRIWERLFRGDRSRTTRGLGLGLGVESGGGFVEEEDGGVADEGAGDGDALSLAHGEGGAALAQRESIGDLFVYGDENPEPTE